MDFDDFVAARGAHLLRTARLLCGDPHLAEDLVQTALAAAYRHWGRVTRSDSPDAYVHRMLVNAHLDWRRRLSNREVIRDLTLDDGRYKPAATAAVEDRDALRQALATLKPKQRTVIVLRYYLDLPDAEIADMLGCAEVTVRVTARRALDALRKRAGSALTPDDMEEHV